ncbi:MAG TPA: V-type ATP synthase subunit E [Candidatus Onthovicinus excrementipullorum]|nr:V-type ATP synthase subunit E [Candidatus Onthovicinus excrementipullorum]
MAESDARVDLFLKDIDHDAVDKRNAIESEVDEYIHTQLSAEEERARDQAEAAVGARKNRLEIEANRKFAAAHNSAKRALSCRRMEMEKEVFNRARKALCAFTASPDYLPFLKKSIVAMAAVITGDAVVLVREQDLPLAQELKTAFGRACEVEADPTVEIGGCRVRDLSNGLLADDTLEARLAAQREWFLTHAKLSVNDQEEVG